MNVSNHSRSLVSRYSTPPPPVILMQWTRLDSAGLSKRMTSSPMLTTRMHTGLVRESVNSLCTYVCQIDPKIECQWIYCSLVAGKLLREKTLHYSDQEGFLHSLSTNVSVFFLKSSSLLYIPCRMCMCMCIQNMYTCIRCYSLFHYHNLCRLFHQSSCSEGLCSRDELFPAGL